MPRARPRVETVPPRMSELLADRRIFGSTAMLWDASAINGCAIEASDGRLGTVSDLLFEDVGWIVRWLVVDTQAIGFPAAKSFCRYRR